MLGRHFFCFILAKIGNMGKLILKVRLGQVHSSLGRRLEAGQALFFYFILAKIGHMGKLILKVRLG